MKYLSLILALNICCVLSYAQESESTFKSQGEITLESRVFQNDRNGATEDIGVGLAPRLKTEYESGQFEAKGRAFGRTDHFDRARSVVIVEEALVGIKTESFNARLGAQMLNWTATEAFHPADIINSRNLDSNFENMEKIGEPMLMLGYRKESHQFQLFGMPARINPAFPSSKSRLNVVSPSLKVGELLWSDRGGVISTREFSPQWAARYATRIKGGDIALHFVQHNDRSEPLFIYDVRNMTWNALFLSVTQYGLTWQQALGGFLVKLEAARRHFVVPSDPNYIGLSRSKHSKAALGLEYGISHENGSESTFIVEGQAVMELPEAERKRLTAFQRDGLVGYRFALGDDMSTEAMLSYIFDLDKEQDRLVSLSFSRRLSDVWSLKTGIRHIHAPQTTALPIGLQAFHKANQFSANLTRHF